MPIRPQDTNPDHPAPGRQPERRTQEPRQYGKDSVFNPAADETGSEEYKKNGLPETTKYTVDKR